MRKVAKFSKVSYEQFKADLEACVDLDQIFMYYDSKDKEEMIRTIYDNIKLPKRATKHSAGYDFYMPYDLVLDKLQGLETALIPTGIRCQMEDDVVLMLYPRSGLGFKYKLQLDNTVGVIDSDYFNAKNQGHIMAKITLDSRDKNELTLYPGDAFMQGIFTEYFITIDDDADAVRTGGFGSTSIKN